MSLIGRFLDAKFIVLPFIKLPSTEEEVGDIDWPCLGLNLFMMLEGLFNFSLFSATSQFFYGYYRDDFSGKMNSFVGTGLRTL